MTISAKIIADSISNGKRITTWELEYPRFIHAELMTHRLFSRNAASSRAIPIDKTLDQVLNNAASPEEWGYNQAGMQAEKSMSGWRVVTAKWLWKQAAKFAVMAAKNLQDFGLHKQIVNRVLEPFVHMKVVVTATEWNNWFYLRDHKDAQPEIRILAAMMKEIVTDATPQELKAGEWHLPYVANERHRGGLRSKLEDGTLITLEDAKKVSSSCCAQVSYRVLDESLEKALKIYDQLVTMTPVHASPFEHQATPMYQKCVDEACDADFECWQDGVTHMDRKGNFWSGNFQGWIQHRQLIDGHVVEG